MEHSLAQGIANALDLCDADLRTTNVIAEHAAKQLTLQDMEHRLQRIEPVKFQLSLFNVTQNGGKPFINVRIDRGIKAEIDETCVLQLWPNKKREGKKDADYRLSVLIPA